MLIGETCVDREPLPAVSGDRCSVSKKADGMVVPRRHEDARMLLGSHTTNGDEVLGIFPHHNAPDHQNKHMKQHDSARSAPRSRCQIMKNEDTKIKQSKYSSSSRIYDGRRWHTTRIRAGAL